MNSIILKTLTKLTVPAEPEVVPLGKSASKAKVQALSQELSTALKQTGFPIHKKLEILLRAAMVETDPSVQAALIFKLYSFAMDQQALAHLYGAYVSKLDEVFKEPGGVMEGLLDEVTENFQATVQTIPQACHKKALGLLVETVEQP